MSGTMRPGTGSQNLHQLNGNGGDEQGAAHQTLTQPLNAAACLQPPLAPRTSPLLSRCAVPPLPAALLQCQGRVSITSSHVPQAFVFCSSQDGSLEFTRLIFGVN